MSKLTRIWGELQQYKKVFLSYLSMIIIPFLVAIVLFVFVQTLMTRQIQSFGEAKAQHFQSEVTSLFREIEIITSSIANDSAISRYLSSSTQALSGNRLNLCEDLRNYADLSSFISSIYVICEDRDHILSSNGLYTANSFDAILAKIGETRESFASSYYDTPDIGWKIGNMGVVEPYYIAPIYAPNSSQVVGEIIIIMYTSALYNILAEEEVALCCLFNQNQYISSIGSDAKQINWYSDSEVSRLLEKNVKCYFTSSDDFTYMVAIPTASFFAPSRAIIFCFLSFFIVVSIVGGYQAIRVARRNFQTISRIIDKLPNAARNNPSYEEIATEIEKALIRYRDNVDRLNLEMQSNSLQWILGGYLAEPPSAKSLTDAGISLNCVGYHVATFFIRDYSDMFFDSRSETENRDIALVIFRSTLSSVAGKRATVSCCRIDGQFSFVLCHVEPDPSDQTATAILHETIHLIECNYGLNLHVALSGWIDSPSQLSKAYHQTQELSRFASSADIDTSFISHKGLISGGEFTFGASYIKQLQILLNTLLMGKYDVIPQMVKTLLSAEVSALGSNYAIGKNSIACISELLSEAVMACDAGTLDKVACAERLRAADSISKLTETVDKVFGELGQMADMPPSSTIDRACLYIRDHLRDPNLSIPEICDAVGVSPQHLSRLFRRQMNQTVSEHINESRINCAKDLLLDKRLTASRVAQEVGYGSNDAFYRNFKKIVGLTPAEYTRMFLDSTRK